MSAWFVMVRERRENTGKEEGGGGGGGGEESSGTNTGTNTAIDDAVAAATREMDYFKLRAKWPFYTKSTLAYLSQHL